MHELSLIKSIVTTVSDISKKDNVKKIKSITVEVGPISGVVKDALLFCYPVAIKGTALDGSVLNVLETKLKMKCLSCGVLTELMDLNYKCVKCESYETEIISGKEFNLVSMEVL